MLQTHPRWSACQGVFLGELDLQPKSSALYLEFSNVILVLDGAVWALLDTLGQKLCLVSSIVYLAQNRGFCEFFHGSWALLLSYGKQHPDWLLSLEASSSNLKYLSYYEKIILKSFICSIRSVRHWFRFLSSFLNITFSWRLLASFISDATVYKLLRAI